MAPAAILSFYPRADLESVTEAIRLEEHLREIAA